MITATFKNSTKQNLKTIKQTIKSFIIKNKVRFKQFHKKKSQYKESNFKL